MKRDATLLAFLVVIIFILLIVLFANLFPSNLKVTNRIPVESNTCKIATVDVVSTQGVPTICYENNTINMVLHNVGRADLIGMKMTVFGTKNIQNYADNIGLTTPLESNAGRILSVEYDSAINGEIEKVKIFPMVLVDNVERACVEHILEISGNLINSC